MVVGLLHHASGKVAKLVEPITWAYTPDDATRQGPKPRGFAQTGDGVWDYEGQGAFIEYDITSAEAAVVQVSVTYLSEDSRPMQVSLNGKSLGAKSDAADRRIKLTDNSRFVLNLDSFIQKNGATINLWEDNGHESQQWVYEDGRIKLAANPRFVLNLDSFTQASGAMINLWEDNGHESQQWVYEDGRIKLAANPRFVLNLHGHEQQNGSAVNLWEDNGHESQQWVVSVEDNATSSMLAATSASFYDAKDKIVEDLGEMSFQKGKNCFRLATTGYSPHLMGVVITGLRTADLQCAPRSAESRGPPPSPRGPRRTRQRWRSMPK